MDDNKTTIMVLIGLFVLFGLAYEPVKNAAQKTDAGSAEERGSSSISNPSTRNDAGKSEETVSKKEVAETLKDTEKSIEKIEKEIQKKIEESKRSPYYNKIKTSNITNRNNSDPNKEYIRISTNLDEGESVNITGWYFKSEVTGNYITIGKASLLPFPFTKNESDVVLEDGDKAIIIKGFSPVGISFRTNICTGYFEENRTFSPSLSKQCPRPYYDEDLPRFSAIEDRNDECLDLIKKVPRCTTRGNEYIRDLPDTVTNSCKTYLTTQINYNSCVTKHFGDTNFPGNEYRIYLNRFGPLWREKKDTINLYDRNGLVVDTISY